MHARPFRESAYVDGQVASLGYRTLAAQDAREALEILRGDTAIDVLFTDVVMPGGMNGGQLAQEAVRLRPGLKVLFTSGYTENVIVHQGRLDGGVQLLNKPHTRADLAAKLRLVPDGPPG